MTAASPSNRLHVAARLEDIIHGRVADLLRMRGWRPRIIPYTTYGCAGVDGTGWVRVLARVKLSPGSTGFVSRDVRRWWREFFTVTAADVSVSLRLGNRRHQVCSVRGGYVDVTLASDLAPGWHEISLGVAGQPEARGRVRVVGPQERVGLVSDIDDTVMITALPRPLLAIWNTLVVHESKRQPVPGMAALYSRLLIDNPDSLVVYVSTGAWNVAPAISRFLARHGYPEGPLLMTDWGPTAEGWFRSGQTHKRTQLRRLVHELPQLRWVLIGDDGQHDPPLYKEIATEAPQAVSMVLIRQLSATEQVLTHGTTTPKVAGQAEAPASPVAWLCGPDGTALTAQLGPVTVQTNRARP